DAEDPRHVEVDALVVTLAQTAEGEEHHAALAPALRAAVEKAGQILAVAPPSPPPPPPTILPAQTVDDVPLDGIDDVFTEAMRKARAALEQNPGSKLNVRWWLE
ncbi:MAG: hypothetical protein O2789_06805, partial [Actinomycetota bacterium]|nr:hypothetical protein [Actinomycetota bacterium]